MNTLKQLNAAIEYIESSLCGEPDINAAAGIACVGADSFMRFFSYMTGMTVTEYIRRRRLTLAADELRHGDTPIVDLAVKYGYDSAAAFSRAFARQHGTTPSDFRKYGAPLTIYPPVSFHISVKGAKAMDFRIIESTGIELIGISRQYDGEGYGAREELRHLMWSYELDDIPGRLCKGHWDEPTTYYDGRWYGIWKDGRYMIAREVGDVSIEHNISGERDTRSAAAAQSADRVAIRLDDRVTAIPDDRVTARTDDRVSVGRTDNEPCAYTLPAGSYAVFRTGRGGAAWEEFPKLFDEIFGSWLPGSGYRQRGDLIIEVLHLWGDRELRRRNRWYEVMIPIEPK